MSRFCLEFAAAEVQPLSLQPGSAESMIDSRWHNKLCLRRYGGGRKGAVYREFVYTLHIHSKGAGKSNRKRVATCPGVPF